MMLLPIVNSREFAVVDDADGKKCDRYKWRCLPTGYVYASISVGPRSTKFLYLHHFILGPIPKGREVDHINGDRLDNRRSNLRIASHHINQVNRHRHNSRNTSGVRGVSWDKRERKWVAHLCVNREHIGLRTHRTLEKAIAVRREAEIKYYGALCPIPKERKELR